nr:ATP-binding protein [Tissierella sp.]
MKIAVLSGKGGTGKTLISVNLAAVAGQANYLDCDVEEPNGHLFFKPDNIKEEKVYVEVPLVDEDKCIACRKCIDFCRFNALAYTSKVLVFENICHSCGGCMIVCPEGAIGKKQNIIGQIKTGTSADVRVISGMLNTGEPSGTPIIQALLKKVGSNEATTIIDCPPGSSCIVMDSIKDADYCVLIAEPTVFGAHNLNMVYDLVTLFKKPFGVVLNKTMEGENPSEILCQEKAMKIIGRIPFDNHLGTLNSDSFIVAREEEKYKEIFSDLLETITREVDYETIINP